MRDNGSGRSRFAAILGAILLIVAAAGSDLAFFAGPVAAEPDQPWRVSESAVVVGADPPGPPFVSGDRILWRDRAARDARLISGRDVATGSTLSLQLAAPGEIVGVDDDWLLAVERGAGGAGSTSTSDSETDIASGALVAYRLSDHARVEVAPETGRHRQSAGVSGATVAWTEAAETSGDDVFVRDLRTCETRRLPLAPAPRRALAISGNLVVWLDRRNASRGDPGGTTASAGANVGLEEADVYGYDLAAGREFRVTAFPERIGPPAISGSVVVWPVSRLDGSGGPRVLGYDLLRASPFTIATLPAESPPVTEVDISGDLVVWASGAAGDSDVFGLDMLRWQQFVVCRAIGDQRRPRISGQTVVWSDARAATPGEAAGRLDVYAARLSPGPAAPPPAFGAPAAADARIEVVWPQDDAPVSEATLANVAVQLLLPDSSDPAPCQWNPRVRLLRAVNDEPARPLALGRKLLGRDQARDGGAVPDWEFDGVDVSAARDPRARVYFLVALDGWPNRTSVWAHAVDARTYFPRPDAPSGVSAGPTGPEGVDAKIEVVWPRGGAPVSEARRANVSALMFRAGSLVSVAPEFAQRVRLLRSLNDGFLEPVAEGEKRLVAASGFVYPAWDFDDVDVSAATDPANRYYFALEVDGVPAASNVWAYGVEPRARAVPRDRPATGCR